ncbi:MAG TPA: 30S ribosomal protein S4 [Elusimicrobiota bacterium]|jgi:small subunit ribosomal protein S4|nr:30S ribosomal protein S4 [Elusimicrobiota bacterium]
MARYIGPVCRLCRREQTKLFLKGEKCYTKCVLENRPTPPGLAKPQRGKPSEYAIRLREKQKLRRMISVTETPFKRLVAQATKSKASTAQVLMALLETRLDNIVRRLGFSTSLATARQLVLHGHLKVNGAVINIPSYHVQVGDVIALSPKLKENVGVKLALDHAKRKSLRPSFVEFNEAELWGKLLREPAREETSFPVNDQLIVEYYSR